MKEKKETNKDLDKVMKEYKGKTIDCEQVE